MNRIIPVSQIGDARAVIKQNAFPKLFSFKSKLLIRLLLLGAFIVALSLFYIWSRIQIVQIGYELNDYTAEQQVLLNENKKLKMELSLMSSPQRIEKFAIEKLQMKAPGKDRIIEIIQ
ncbi:MAG: cell division protein FtsL [Deltaproteobacteria bacterium]|nr:cell division protein FtsL [Deltaproteobacteria bacterium]